MKKLKNEEESFCGNCCWFYAEDTYGYGGCPFQFARVRQCNQKCNKKKHFISKERMEHHLAVIKNYLREKKEGYYDNEARWPDELNKPLEFACKYIETFSQL